LDKNKVNICFTKIYSCSISTFFLETKNSKKCKDFKKNNISNQKTHVYDFCNKDLKESIEKYRKLKLEKEDKEREKKQSVESSNDKENKEKNDKNDQMDVDDNEQKIDENDLETGYYELCGIVTHKGRSANSGHYIGYAKDSARGIWLKFDDEDVTEIKEDDVKQLYGGGDHQMAFLCIFRKIEPKLTSD